MGTRTGKDQTLPLYTAVTRPSKLSIQNAWFVPFKEATRRDWLAAPERERFAGGLQVICASGDCLPEWNFVYSSKAWSAGELLAEAGRLANETKIRLSNMAICVNRNVLSLDEV